MHFSASAMSPLAVELVNQTAREFLAANGP
jgi:hypothetical protein